ncbi:DUF637 domain-containing protein [Marinimicrobium locisalis]|uniref:DUF637 domain-containing protein n=1 Tax=Marinimicrobium locisalis TaxID=546022 RepID=UPI003221C546
MKTDSTLLQQVRVSTGFKRLCAYFLCFVLLLQGSVAAQASVLSNRTIERDIASSPLFVPAASYDDGKYGTHEFMEQSAPGGATDLESFYSTLEEQPYRHHLGEPRYVPINTGGITTIIPTYEKPRYIGSPLVQSRYIRHQIQHLLGRNLIDADSNQYATETKQLNTLYQNALAYLESEGGDRLYGEALGLDQTNSGLSQPALVWPEFREINGETVVVPVVYLNNGTYQARKVTDHDTTFNGVANFPNVTIDGVTLKGGRETFLRVAGDLKNNQGVLHGDGYLNVLVDGDLENLSGKVMAEGDLFIGAHNIINRTIVHRYDFGGSQGGKFGEIASVQSGTGNVKLQASNDILIEGGIVEAPSGGITFEADGSIYIGSVQYGTSSSHDGGWYNSSRSQTHFLTSRLSAQETISLMANENIVIDAAELSSDEGHITLLASLGITIEDDLQESRYQSHSKWNDTTTDISSYKTVAIRSVLDAGKGVRIHSLFGDITLKATDIRSQDGTVVNADNGKVNMLMTVENDHFSYQSVRESLLTVRSTSRGHNIENGVMNSIVGGFEANALYGVSVEYEGDPDLSLDEQLDHIADFEGMDWIDTVRANTTPEDWQAIITAHEQWDESSTTLSPAAMAIISIAVAVATQGAGSGLADMIVGKSAEGVFSSALHASIQAGTTSMISQASVAVANGAVNGDVGGALEELASSDTLRNLATAMVTAGAMDYLDAQFFTNEVSQSELDAVAAKMDIAQGSPEYFALKDTMAELSFGQQAVQALTEATVSSGVDTVMNGGSLSDFGANLGPAVVQNSINLLGKELANKIGDASKIQDKELRINTATKYIAHAALGCVMGAATSANDSGNSDEVEQGCASGAGGAVVGEFVAEQIRQDFFNLAEDGARTGELTPLEAEELYNKYKEQGVNMARLSAALSAFAFGGDVNIADSTAKNAAEHNAFWFLVIPAFIALDKAWTAYQYVSWTIDLGEAIKAGDEDRVNELLEEKSKDFAVEIAVGVMPGGRILKSAAEQLKKRLPKNSKVLDDLNEYAERLEDGNTQDIVPGRRSGEIPEPKFEHHAGGTKSSFDVAKEGGKHAGFLKNNLARSSEELTKGISKLERQIALHQDKIANPSKYIDGWGELDPRQQQALINKKWPSDILRQREQRDILKGILNDRS